MLHRRSSLEVDNDTLSVSLTIDFLKLKQVRNIARIGWATFLPILALMGLYVINLWANTC